MNKQTKLEALKKEWIKSGAYRTEAFKVWYDNRAERIASKWFAEFATK